MRSVWVATLFLDIYFIIFFVTLLFRTHIDFFSHFQKSFLSHNAKLTFFVSFIGEKSQFKIFKKTHRFRRAIISTWELNSKLSSETCAHSSVILETWRIPKLFSIFTKKWGVKLSKKARDFSGSSSHRSLKSFEFSPSHFFDSELCTFYNPVQWHCTMAEKRSSNSRNIETFFFREIKISEEEGEPVSIAKFLFLVLLTSARTDRSCGQCSCLVICFLPLFGKTRCCLNEFAEIFYLKTGFVRLTEI